MSIFAIAGLRMTSEDSSPRYILKSTGKSQKHLSYNNNTDARSDRSASTTSSSTTISSLSSNCVPSASMDRQATSLDEEGKKEDPPTTQCSSTIHPPAPPLWMPYPSQQQQHQQRHPQTLSNSRTPFYQFYCLPAYVPSPPVQTMTTTSNQPPQSSTFIPLHIRPVMAPWIPAFPVPPNPGSTAASTMETSETTQKSVSLEFPTAPPEVVWMVPWIVSFFVLFFTILCLLISEIKYF